MIFDIYASRISESDIKLLEKYSERVNSLLGIELEGLIHLPYRQLKAEIPDLIGQGKLTEAIYTVLRSKAPRLKRSYLWLESNVNKLKFVFWIQDQYKQIGLVEQKHLLTPPDIKLLNAGITDLDILGDVNLIDALAGGDILKWEAIEALPYEKIFDKQLKNVIEQRIQKRLEPPKLNK